MTQSAFSQGIWVSEPSDSFSARYSYYTGVVNGMLYAIGGEEAFQIPIQEFDPATQSWTTPGFTNEDSALFGGTSCTVGGKIYIVGGWDQGQMDSDLIVVDPAARTLTRPATIGHFVPRASPASAALGGLIYIFGGAKNYGPSQPIDTIEVLDTSTLTVKILKTTGPYSPAAGMSASVANGKIYLIGGQDSVGGTSNLVQIFDPATNTWSQPTTTGYFASRAFHAAGVIEGKIYVAAGGNIAFDLGTIRSWTGSPDTNELQMFDPATNAWSTPKTTGILTSRTDLQGEVIDGKLYTLGGYRPHSPVNDFEVFTPVQSGVSQTTIGRSLVVFPNPTTRFVMLSGIQSDLRQIEVENFIGVPVSIITPAISDAANGDLQLDLSRLQPGAYFIRVEYLDGRSDLRSVVKE